MAVFFGSGREVDRDVRRSFEKRPFGVTDRQSDLLFERFFRKEAKYGFEFPDFDVADERVNFE